MARHCVARHCVARHCVARHCVARHFLDRHFLDRHFLDRHFLDRHFLDHGSVANAFEGLVDSLIVVRGLAAEGSASEVVGQAFADCAETIEGSA